MRKSRFSEAQIIGVLREQESGATTAEVCRRDGISEQTFYPWKAKYGGIGPLGCGAPEEPRGREPRLKKLLAESMLDVAALKDLLAKTELACGAANGGAASDCAARLLATARLQAAPSGPEDGAACADGGCAGDPPEAAPPGRRAPALRPPPARFRVLAIVEDFTREALALVVDSSIGSRRFVRALDALIARHGRPAMIVSDNGTEL